MFLVSKWKRGVSTSSHLQVLTKIHFSIDVFLAAAILTTYNPFSIIQAKVSSPLKLPSNPVKEKQGLHTW